MISSFTISDNLSWLLLVRWKDKDRIIGIKCKNNWRIITVDTTVAVSSKQALKLKPDPAGPV